MTLAGFKQLIDDTESLVELASVLNSIVGTTEDELSFPEYLELVDHLDNKDEELRLLN